MTLVYQITARFPFWTSGNR